MLVLLQEEKRMKKRLFAALAGLLAACTIATVVTPTESLAYSPAPFAEASSPEGAYLNEPPLPQYAEMAIDVGHIGGADIAPAYSQAKTLKWVKRGNKYLLSGRDGIRRGDRITTVKVNGHTYLVDSGGWMVTGWYKGPKHWYYLNTSGKNVGLAVVGWKKISSKWYVFNKRGENRSGWVKDNGNVYYFAKDKDGKAPMKTGWVKSGGAWYYMKPKTGQMAFSETLKISGKIYKFAKDGKCTNRK